MHPDRVLPVIPTMEVDGKPYVPQPSGRLLTPYTLDIEREFQEVRSELAKQYGVLNRLNRATVSTADDWIGIAACGQTYYELREALQPARLQGRRVAPPRRGAPRPAVDAGPARRERGAPVRSRPEGSAHRRGEEPDPRGSREGRAVPVGRASSRHRPVRRRGPPADPRHWRARRRHAARPAALPTRPRARRGSGRSAPADGRTVAHPAHREPHALLLQRLPAQHLDEGSRGHARRRRHRVPRHGRPDGTGTGRRHRRADRDGQRGCAVDRHVAVHRSRPHRAEPRRRHLLPLRLAGRAAPPARPA